MPPCQFRESPHSGPDNRRRWSRSQYVFASFAPYFKSNRCGSVTSTGLTCTLAVLPSDAESRADCNREPAYFQQQPQHHDHA